LKNAPHSIEILVVLANEMRLRKFAKENCGMRAQGEPVVDMRVGAGQKGINADA